MIFMTYFNGLGRSPITTKNGMAATSNKLATEVAVEVLKSGGNAMDAAVAACAVQCVVEPQSTGIGGDCFAMYAPSGGTDLVAYNGSGRAPKAANRDWYVKRGYKEIDPSLPPCRDNPRRSRCMGSAHL